MKSKYIVVIVVVLAILVLGYLGRHKIKTMLGGSTTSVTPVAETTTPSSSPEMQANPSASITMTKTDPAKGAYLTDSKGMSLYIFDKDTKGVSNCTDVCLAKWPAFVASSPLPSPMPANFDVIKRADGTMQYTYKGMPLYYYSLDKAPGDTTGDGVGGTWHLAKP